MKTQVETNINIYNCLELARDYLEENKGVRHIEYIPINDKQKQFLSKESDYKGDFPRYSKDDLKGKASRIVKEINNYLESEGFSIRLTESGDNPLQFAVASILNIKTEWKESGEKHKIFGNSVNYKGFELKDSKNQPLWSVKIKDYASPLITIETKSGDFADILQVDPLKPLGTPTEAYDWLVDQEDVSSDDYRSIILPEIDLVLESDISWLAGLQLKINNNNWYIDQALQETFFKLDKLGTSVKSATAMVFSGSVSSRTYKTWIFNSSFYIWIRKFGCEQPYFAALITPDNFIEEQ